MPTSSSGSFHVQSVTYTVDGESSRYHPGLLPEIDNPQDIETHHFFDWNALGNVERRIIANRKATGLPEYYSGEFRNAERESVEDELRRADEDDLLA